MNHYDVGYTDYINGVQFLADVCRRGARNQEETTCKQAITNKAYMGVSEN